MAPPSRAKGGAMTPVPPPPLRPPVPVLAWDGDKVDFACASWGEGPVLQSLSALGLNASYSSNRAMHDFVTKLALLSRMLGSVSYAICPYPSRIITGGANKAEKVPNFYKTNISKTGFDKFSKKYISGITKASAFEWYLSGTRLT